MPLPDICWFSDYKNRQHKCPKCGCKNIRRLTLDTEGFPLVSVLSSATCEKCKHSWTETWWYDRRENKYGI